MIKLKPLLDLRETYTETNAFDQGKKSDDETKNEAKQQSRYRNILRKWDSSAGAHKDEVVGADNFKKTEIKNIAYTFRRVYDPETGEKGAYSELDIEDDGLIALLRSVIDNRYPGVNFDGDLVNMSAPFAPIVSNGSLLCLMNLLIVIGSQLGQPAKETRRDA
jgi:hypothetical protein